MAGVDILATAFNGANAAFIADLYARWAERPGSVDASFAELFAALNDEARSVLTDAIRRVLGAAALRARRARNRRVPPAKPEAKAAGRLPGPSAAELRAATLDSIRALMMIRVYRVRGHLEAKLDPLGLTVPKQHPELDPASYGFGPGPTWTARSSSTTCSAWKPRPRGRSSTCCAAPIAAPVGIEFMHIQDPDQKAWLQRRIEGAAWRPARWTRRPRPRSCSS